jgi:hypothetical protein
MMVVNPAVLYALVALQWLLLLFVGGLVLGAFNQIVRLQQQIEHLSPTPSRLRKGDPLPADLGTALPRRALVAVLSPGCSGCVDLCRRLRDLVISDWTLVAVISGATDTAATELPVPETATVVGDQERRWILLLGIKALPTVLAFADDRLVAQQVGPNTSWLLSFAQEPVIARREVTQQVV